MVPLLPPSRDAVGVGALKVHNLLAARGIGSAVVTSSDQRGGEGIATIVKKWTVWHFPAIGSLLKQSGSGAIVLHYP